MGDRAPHRGPRRPRHRRARPGPVHSLGSRPLASGALGFHILDTMLAIEEAVTTGHTVDIRSTVDPVPLVADDWDPFAATL